LNWLEILKEDFLPITRVKVLARTLVREQNFNDFYQDFKNSDKNSREAKQFSRFLDNLSGNTPNRKSLFDEIDKFSDKKGKDPREAKKRFEKLMSLRTSRPTKTKDPLMDIITRLHDTTKEVERAKRKPDGASDELLQQQSKLREETETFLEQTTRFPLTGKGGDWNRYPDALNMWQYIITRQQKPYFSITPYEGNEDIVDKFAEMIDSDNKNGKLYKKTGQFTGFNELIKLINSNASILEYYNENIRKLTVKFVKNKSSSTLDKDALRMTRDKLSGIQYTVKTFTETTIEEYIETINEAVSGNKSAFIPNDPLIKNYVMISGMGDSLLMSPIAKTILSSEFGSNWVDEISLKIRDENLFSDYAIERKLVDEIYQTLQQGKTEYKGIDLSEYDFEGSETRKKRKITDLVKNRKNPSRLSMGFNRLKEQNRANLPVYLRNNPSISEAKIIENEYSDIYDVVYFNGKEENNKPTTQRDSKGQIIMANTEDGATHAQIYNKDSPTEVIGLSDIKEELDYIGEQRMEEGKKFNNPTLIRLREISGLNNKMFARHLLGISQTKGLMEIVRTFDIEATIPNLSIDEFLGFIGLTAEVVGADGLLSAYEELDDKGDIEVAKQIEKDIPQILNNLKTEIISDFQKHVELFAKNYTGGKFKLGRGGSTKAKEALEALSDEGVGILRRNM